MGFLFWKICWQVQIVLPSELIKITILKKSEKILIFLIYVLGVATYHL